MLKNTFTLCIIYVSEATNQSNLEALKQSIDQKSKFPDSNQRKAWLLHSFRDITYNRTSFFLAGRYADVRVSALELCRTAFRVLVS